MRAAHILMEFFPVVVMTEVMRVMRKTAFPVLTAAVVWKHKPVGRRKLVCLPENQGAFSWRTYAVLSACCTSSLALCGAFSGSVHKFLPVGLLELCCVFVHFPKFSEDSFKTVTLVFGEVVSPCNLSGLTGPG